MSRSASGESASSKQVWAAVRNKLFFTICSIKLNKHAEERQTCWAGSWVGSQPTLNSSSRVVVLAYVSAPCWKFGGGCMLHGLLMLSESSVHFCWLSCTDEGHLCGWSFDAWPSVEPAMSLAVGFTDEQVSCFTRNAHQLLPWLMASSLTWHII